MRSDPHRMAGGRWRRPLAMVGMLGLVASTPVGAQTTAWSARERALIDSLSLEQLGPPPPSPSNVYADDPAAASLGAAIFSDTRFSANGEVSCASCHHADYGLTDPHPRGRGIGETRRRTMPIAGMAWQRWFFWDGRADSLWSQTLGPLQDPVEHGLNRVQVLQLVQDHYAELYGDVFGPLPTREGDDGSVTQVLVNVGKALAAHVRTFLPEETRFDRFASDLREGNSGDEHLSEPEKRGLRLFLSDARCVNCHNGPMFSNGEFHHSGTPDDGTPDLGRGGVIAEISSAEFGFFSRWSDADPTTDGDHIRFLNAPPHKYERTFKTPSLRGVGTRPPYMHNGIFETLSEVLHNYRVVSGTPLADEIFHGELSDRDLADLEAFLMTLSPTFGSNSTVSTE